MKRLMRLVLIVAASTALCLAVEGEKKEGGEGGSTQTLKWINFLLLAGGIGYLIGKNAGPFFNQRGQEIRKDIADAEKIQREAEARVAEVERKLASLGAEIEALRVESQKEGQAERERLAAQTTAEMAKIQSHAEQEIAAASKAARMDLRRYSAELAVELAEKKIRSRMTPAAQDSLVRGFVRDLQ